MRDTEVIMHAERLRELTEIYRAAARKVHAEADREDWDKRQVDRMYDIAIDEAQQAAMATGATWSTAAHRGDVAAALDNSRIGVETYDMARHRHLGQAFRARNAAKLTRPICGHSWTIQPGLRR
jgi:hypothetical protein